MTTWELGWIADEYPVVEPLFSSGEDDGQWLCGADSESYRLRA